MARTLQVQLVENDTVLVELKFATQLTAEEVFPRLQQLFASTAEPQEVHQQGAAPTSPSQVPLKYRALAEHLLAQSGRSLKMTFQEVEAVLGLALPPSARHRAWWANTDSHTHAKAWLSVGWKTARADLDTQSVEFHRQA